MVTSQVAVLKGVKGGVGATTLAVNLAASMAAKVKTLIIDIDDKCLGDTAFYLGVNRVRLLEDIQNNINLNSTMLESYLSSGCDGVGCLQCSTSEFETSQGVAAIFEKLSQIYGYILFNAGDVEGEEGCFKFANRMVLVSGLDQSSIMALAREYGKLKRAQVDTRQIDIVASSLSPSNVPNIAAISQKIGATVSWNFPYVKGEMEQAAMGGRPILLSNTQHAYTKEIHRFAEYIMGSKREERLLKEKEPGLQNKTDYSAKEYKKAIIGKLTSVNDIKKIIEEGGVKGRDVLEKKITNAVHQILDSEAFGLPGNRDSLIKDILDEVVGLGPLEKYLVDADVTEIMVNGKDDIYIEREGRLGRVPERFSDNENLMTVVERIVAPIGRRIDESSPIVDARLPDGSRVHVVIPPLALNGPVITIRKFNKSIFSVDDLIAHGSINSEIAEFLGLCVQARANVLISGGTGSGKTTMLNLLSSFISSDERVVTIEDSAELKLTQPHVVSLESRPSNIEGRGKVDIRDLVKASLRMRPDRIIVGECRGAEALDMLQAMNTGHDGSLTTIHSNGCREALSRLETLVLFAGFELPIKAIREQITSAIDIIVQVKRMRDGSRKIVTISEITGLEGQTITLQELFTFKNNKFISSGFRPKVLENALSLCEGNGGEEEAKLCR